jgi:hypothetical protein
MTAGLKKIGVMDPIFRPLPEYFNSAKIDREILSDGTEKSDNFADDANIVTVQEHDCVLAIQEILNEFYLISGLKCNIEKTSIMFFGPDNVGEQEKIRTMGFLICPRVKCLGFELSSDGGELTNNIDTDILNIRRLAGEWSRYNLSLQGRLAVSKTFLISQLTYHGSIITPTPVQVENIQTVVDGFILKGIPWSKRTLYNKPENAGLGAVKVSEFLQALKCVWFKRIFLGGINDNWRFKIMERSFFLPTCFRPENVCNSRPLEHGIGTAFWNFLKKFWMSEKNIL